MNRWQDKHWPVGTPVEVTDVNDKRLGVGVLLNEYIPTEEWNDDWDLDDDCIPRIEMPDGKIIHGYECWWIPVVIAKEAEFQD